MIYTSIYTKTTTKTQTPHTHTFNALTHTFIRIIKLVHNSVFYLATTVESVKEKEKKATKQYNIQKTKTTTTKKKEIRANRADSFCHYSKFLLVIRVFSRNRYALFPSLSVCVWECLRQCADNITLFKISLICCAFFPSLVCVHSLNKTIYIDTVHLFVLLAEKILAVIICYLLNFLFFFILQKSSFNRKNV